MAKPKPKQSPAGGDGYAFLTEAAALGANLEPALRVLMHLPAAREATGTWLVERPRAPR
jgi:hypothetical protein